MAQATLGALPRKVDYEKKKSRLTPAERKEARLVSKLVHSEFNKLRDTLRMLLEDRFELYDNFLCRHELMKRNTRALGAVRTDLRNALRYLKSEIKIVVPECRDSAAERAIERQFKLFTIAGKVSGK